MSQTVLTETFFTQFDLHPLLQQGLDEAGFARCTPIQALTLPVALTNRLLTQPAVAERKDADPRALVIAPTRELAIQIEKDAKNIGRYTGLRTALIYGGVDYDKQRQQLKDGCDIIIATPGRLLDYHKQNVFGFNGVEVMVIDEADRMFDLGFIKDVRFIFRRLPAREQRQVLLFSATLSHRVLELAYEHMHNAEKMVVETDNVTADRVRQQVYFPAKEEKMPLLLNLLGQASASRSIIFVNTKAAAERITDRVKRQGYRVGALSGDVPQLKRQKLLQRFQDGQLDILVCTDVAARGLHIPAVSHVFNYDLPQDAEDYVHRIGRTARLGAEGDAISFACDLYAMSLPEIEEYIGQKIPVAAIDPGMLVMPEPKQMDAQFAADSAADSAAFGDRVTPREDAKKPSRGSRRPDGRRGEHSGSAPERRREDRPRKPRDAAAVKKDVQPTQMPAPASVPAQGDATGEGKRRRRRGGRGRRREGAPGTEVATNHAMNGNNGNSRPSRQVVAQSPAGGEHVAPKKQGFFRRLTRLFTGR
jgi:ATP-dependent RNA helicase RhlB